DECAEEEPGESAAALRPPAPRPLLEAPPPPPATPPATPAASDAGSRWAPAWSRRHRRPPEL
ncbi:hypothetical protein P7K49_006221, partial [Saguinus oedipus]